MTTRNDNKDDNKTDDKEDNRNDNEDDNNDNKNNLVVTPSPTLPSTPLPTPLPTLAPTTAAPVQSTAIYITDIASETPEPTTLAPTPEPTTVQPTLPPTIPPTTSPTPSPTTLAPTTLAPTVAETTESPVTSPATTLPPTVADMEPVTAIPAAEDQSLSAEEIGRLANLQFIQEGNTNTNISVAFSLWFPDREGLTGVEDIGMGISTAVKVDLIAALQFLFCGRGSIDFDALGIQDEKPHHLCAFHINVKNGEQVLDVGTSRQRDLVVKGVAFATTVTSSFVGNDLDDGGIRRVLKDEISEWQFHQSLRYKRVYRQ
jgi:hypothetical protein